MLKKKYFKTKDECEVTFEVENDGAKSMALVSEANEWKPVKMSKRRKDGKFYTRIRLPKEGQFQFRYLVDGENWMNDSEADAYVANEFGGRNSVVVTSRE